MSAIDTAKDILRIGTTAGLSKDVIDLLEKKAALLAEQVTVLEQENTTLLRENRQLKLENENLQRQLQSAKPKEGLTEQTTLVLKYFFAKAGNETSERELAHRFQISMSVAGYHVDILLKKRFIQQLAIGMTTAMGTSDATFGITSQGRAYCVENGLAA